MAVPSSWTMIRVRKETRERLLALARHLVELAEQGTTDVPEINPDVKNPECSGLSFDALINRLIDRVYAKRQRAKDSRERARQAKRVRDDATENDSAT